MRAAAWREVLAAAGVRTTAVQVRENTDREGYEGARLLLDADDRPTGILCFSDTLAWSAVRAAQDLDLHVPHDVSVVGFDDAQIARRARPAAAASVTTDRCAGIGDVVGGSGSSRGTLIALPVPRWVSWRGLAPPTSS